MAKLATPHRTESSLLPLNNHFVVNSGLFYEYYKLSPKTFEAKGLFINLTYPLLEVEYALAAQGLFVIINKRIHVISLEDYMRGRVNVSREYNPSTNSGNDESTQVPVKMEAAHQITGEQRSVGQSSRDGLSETIDMAWAEQIEALHYLEDPEG